MRDYRSDTRHRNYAVGPDGAFYFIAPVPGVRSKLIVVQNWLEELKTLVP